MGKRSLSLRAIVFSFLVVGVGQVWLLVEESRVVPTLLTPLACAGRAHCATCRLMLDMDMEWESGED